MTLSAILSVLLFAAVCQGGIVSGPENLASYPGPALTLRCSATQGTRVMWYEFITVSSGSIISDGSVLITSHPNYARYRLTVDEVAGTFDLTITPTQVIDGGRYMCTDGTTISKSAEIVMLVSKATCNNTLPGNGIVTENDYYSIQCSQKFQASEGIAPLMTWTGPGQFNDLYVRQNGSVFSGVSFNVQKEQDAGKFKMLVNFTEADFIGVDQATNAPTFTDTWESQYIYVQYGPQTVVYTPVYPSYEIGTVLTCTADASPLPSYKWTDLMTLIDYNSQTITLSESMVGLLNLRCQVVNSVGTVNIFVNSTLNPRTTTPTPTTPTTTTTAPPVSNCLDLTGRWEYTRAADSKAVLCLYVDSAQNGYVSGLLWNDTQTEAYYMEIMGRTRNNIFDETGFVGIWPLEVGVSAYAAECHRCYGDESLLVNPISRSSSDNAFCGDGGLVLLGEQYTFKRVPPSYPCATGTTWADLRAVSRQAAAQRLKRRAQKTQ
jgi:hypothetical protein